MKRSFRFFGLTLWTGVAVLASFVCILQAVCAAEAGFALQDKPGQYLDVLVDGRIVARYMYQYDKSTPEKLDETYKPYLHVFDAEGVAPITKGPGGLYPHHRGLFIGWNKIVVQDKDHDRWHMRGGEIVHQTFLERKTDADQATVTSLTFWNAPDGKPLLQEKRTMVFRRAPAPGRVTIDFNATLMAGSADVLLDGDPEHAGVQYRPANEVDRKHTIYVFPKEQADATKDFDYPWVGESYTLNGKRYSVVDMNHPCNPKKTIFSAYRDYGRFGAFFVEPIKSGASLAVKYRFLIVDGEMPPIDMIQKCWDQFAGVSSRTLVPKVTVKAAE